MADPKSNPGNAGDKGGMSDQGGMGSEKKGTWKQDDDEMEQGGKGGQGGQGGQQGKTGGSGKPDTGSGGRH
jgi:hypothetical protein